MPQIPKISMLRRIYNLKCNCCNSASLTIGDDILDIKLGNTIICLCKVCRDALKSRL